MGQLLDGVERIFVAILGMYGFARLEYEQVAANLDRLRLRGDQVNFHAALGAVEDCPMLEMIYIEIAMQLTVNPRQDVLVELRSDSRCVVIGSQQSPAVMCRVHAEKEPAVAMHQTIKAA